MKEKVSRYWHTLRHVPVSRLVSRLFYNSRKGWAIKQAKRVSGNSVKGNPMASFWPKPGGTFRIEEGASSLNLLNQSYSYAHGWDWDAQDRSALWQFNLNYFHYIHAWSPEVAEKVCADWIAANPLGHEPAWHPYPTSLRIINWIKYGFQNPTIQKSLFEQLVYLARFCEHHLGGNHLLENVRALLFGSKFFSSSGEAKKWSETALKILSDELPRQILQDGGHFERSPMYHAIVLEGLIDIWHLVDEQSLPPSFEDAVCRMLQYQNMLTHPDGNIALFSDAAHGVALPTAELNAYASSICALNSETVSDFAESGYFIFEDESVYFVLDAGPIGPKDLPAHGHADIFSFELSIGGLRFVVDTGVSAYGETEIRQHERSTAAHNTVTIDGRSQAECWGSFRVGRRYDPSDRIFSTTSNGFLFSGSFDGFSKLIGDGLVHTREVSFESDKGRMSFNDIISGSGNHFFTSRLHLHPEVNVMDTDRGVVLARGDVQVLFTSDSDYVIEDSWYSPEFGMRVANRVIALKDQFPRQRVSFELHL